jgi:hypothetical protein
MSSRLRPRAHRHEIQRIAVVPDVELTRSSGHGVDLPNAAFGLGQGARVREA